MNSTLSAEERIARWLVEEAPGELPNRVLSTAFERTREMPQEHPSVRGRLRSNRRVILVLAAAFILAGPLVASGVGGRLLQIISLSPTRDSLTRVQTAGILRVAVRPDHPQATPPGGTFDGFDVDVAKELARRLGVRVELEILSPTQMLDQPAAWDIALPSTPAWLLDPGRIGASAPYYYWPHNVLVPAGSELGSIVDLGGRTVCAVAGDAGVGWLRGEYGGSIGSATHGLPVATSVVVESSDAGCVEAVRSGRTDAMVTATFSPADVAAYAELRAIGGPDPEARVVAVPGDGPDSLPLLNAINTALDDMRRDGTLSRVLAEPFRRRRPDGRNKPMR